MSREVHVRFCERAGVRFPRATRPLKASLKGKRKYAGWDDAFMATLMAG